jgi:predicted amidohydrolase YtcJ
MTVTLLTNIGRLWTGTDLMSNAAVILNDDRVAWVGSSTELPSHIPGVISDIVEVDHVENLSGGLVTPGLIDAHTTPSTRATATPRWPCAPTAPARLKSPRPEAVWPPRSR